MDPFTAGAAFYRPTSQGNISSIHTPRKHGANVKMNVTAHLKENKNNTGKKEKRQATDFKDSETYL